MGTTHRPPVGALDLEGVRTAVDEVLCDFLAERTRDRADPSLARMAGLLDAYLAGGKRLRPLFCVAGWHAGGAGGAAEPVLGAAAALELFHAFALIHDDVMDDSALRRGRPSAHRVFFAAAPAALPEPERRRFGVNSAILLGDLALVWSDELLMSSLAGHPRQAAVLPLVGRMRTALVIGQQRDLLATGSGAPADRVPRQDAGADAELAAAFETIRHKTAGYTVEHPLLLGATLAGARDGVLRVCRAYAGAVGEAFQLRDDLLGVFGDPCRTGKPSVDDLRSGKRTPLVVLARRAAGPAQRRVLNAHLGDPGLDAAGAEAVRRVLRGTGAVEAVERMIADRRDAALAVLSDPVVPPPARRALADLARAATDRER